MALDTIIVNQPITDGEIITSAGGSFELGSNAQLLDSGNLIMRNGNDSDPENSLWQSFDYPCDTLLPGMKFGWNRVTGLDRHLSSWRSADDPSKVNGICKINESPKCECIKGFRPKIQSNWDMADWSNGCIPSTRLDCEKGDGFEKYSGVKLPDTQSSWFNESMNLKECASLCLSNCSCTAYANSDIRGAVVDAAFMNTCLTKAWTCLFLV
ncbi:G-type lectin S-receptor-like serine/threonine-protein kinase [Vitis vinifera]|uniref:G-type lectin S-receptor-like serine/threonine-protein kinase n=1 Tax=Vitis vinifera TaxID=29760 RepID=A0A438DP50_VITVI|nr:G-type lectin S-receptor-like serine/threonine-protein kinase [Vitis vinifera]